MGDLAIWAANSILTKQELNIFSYIFDEFHIKLIEIKSKNDISPLFFSISLSFASSGSGSMSVRCKFINKYSWTFSLND